MLHRVPLQAELWVWGSRNVTTPHSYPQASNKSCVSGHLMSEVPIHLVDQIYCLDEAVFPDQVGYCYQQIVGPCAVMKLVVNKREPE